MYPDPLLLSTLLNHNNTEWATQAGEEDNLRTLDHDPGA